MNIRFGSVCSGIEAASVAFRPLGWEAAWLAEIEPFPSAVLAHHYPDVPNLGDMTTIAGRVASGEIEAPDVLCGGTPCQTFSIAGLRGSLEDARGQLTLEFVRLANAIDDIRRHRGEPECTVLWENVPGVLSTDDNAFGCFLGALAGCDTALDAPPGRGWTDAGLVVGPRRTVAWRVLDAQYFGLAQRRKRVFVVASAGDRFDPAAVLFEFDGVRRDSAPSREAGKDTTGSTGDGIARCITTGEAKRQDWETCNMIAHSLRGEGFDASEDGTGRGTPLVPVAFSCKDYGGDAGEISPTLRSMSHHGSHANAGGQVAIAFHPTQDPISSTDGTTHAMGCGSSQGTARVVVAFAQNSRDEVRMINGDGAIAGALAAEAGTKQQTYIAQSVSLRGREGGATAELGDEVGNCLRASSGGGDKPHVLAAMQVRRLTPVECARLQGFPDDYLDILYRKKPAADGPKYKALGNSWAVPCVAWIGKRIHGAMESA